MSRRRKTLIDACARTECLIERNATADAEAHQSRAATVATETMPCVATPPVPGNAAFRYAGQAYGYLESWNGYMRTSVGDWCGAHTHT